MPINVVRAFKHLPGVTDSNLFTFDGKGLDGEDFNNSVHSWTRAERIASESGIGKLLEWWAEADNGAFYASATGGDGFRKKVGSLRSRSKTYQQRLGGITRVIKCLNYLTEKQSIKDLMEVQ